MSAETGPPVTGTESPGAGQGCGWGSRVPCGDGVLARGGVSVVGVIRPGAEGLRGLPGAGRLCGRGSRVPHWQGALARGGESVARVRRPVAEGLRGLPGAECRRGASTLCPRASAFVRRDRGSGPGAGHLRTGPRTGIPAGSEHRPVAVKTGGPSEVAAGQDPTLIAGPPGFAARLSVVGVGGQP